MAKPTLRHIEGTANDFIVPQSTREIDDAVGTTQEVINARGSKYTPDSDEENTAKPEVLENIDPKVQDLASIIGNGVSRCMRDRAVLRSVELRLDEWFRSLPASKNRRIGTLDGARKQMETAKLAVDALYSRFRAMAVTARN